MGDSNMRNGFFGGIGLGTIIAVVISWSANHSVIWAIIHGILGWLYVIYYLIMYKLV